MWPQGNVNLLEPVLSWHLLFEEYRSSKMDRKGSKKNPNHEGSAAKIEVNGIIEMFKRSEEKYGVKYSHYIGDGDTKTFQTRIYQKKILMKMTL